MRSLIFSLTLCAPAAPAAAQLTTTYTGTQRDGDKAVPASAEFTIQNGRALMVMKGSHAMRMIFDDRAQVLHILSDDDKRYFDITKANAASGDPTGMMGEMQKQLENMPKEQRAQAEAMMKGMMGTSAAQPPLTYVWTKETKEIAGYECTLVEGMRGDNKVTEYCGTKSSDFTISDAERATMLDMQGYLRNFGISVQSGDETRAFQWDTSVDGYPVLTRCYRNGTMTLELQLASVSRKPVPDEMFEMPRGWISGRECVADSRSLPRRVFLDLGHHELQQLLIRPRLPPVRLERPPVLDRLDIPPLTQALEQRVCFQRGSPAAIRNGLGERDSYLLAML